MDNFNPKALTAAEYMNGTSSYRTELYSQCGTVLSHKESISLFKSFNVKMAPELKSPSVDMPYEGSYTQEQYAQQMIDEYKAAGVPATQVFAQSFNLNDVVYWVNHEPDFGSQVVYLDGRYDDPNFNYRLSDTWIPSMAEIKSKGVNYLAPPMWMLVDLNNDKKIIPSYYSLEAKKSGLKLITWTLERSGLMTDGGGWYYQSTSSAIKGDGDIFEVLDVLTQDVGIVGIFSDWPATVTYYANCLNRK